MPWGCLDCGPASHYPWLLGVTQQEAKRAESMVTPFLITKARGWQGPPDNPFNTPLSNLTLGRKVLPTWPGTDSLGDTAEVRTGDSHHRR